MSKILVVCTTDSMITNFLIPHITDLENKGNEVWCASSKTGPFFDNILKEGISAIEIPFERSPFSLKNITAFCKLRKFIRENQFDLIFCHEPVGGAMGRMVGHFEGIPVIYMAHGFHFFKGAPPKMRLFYLIEKFLSRWTDTLITINQEDYEASLKFFAKRKFKTNGIGIDTSKFNLHTNKLYIRQLLGIDLESVVILSVGELSERKNHRFVIEAISKLRNKHIHYVIAGEGEKHGELQKLIMQHNLNGNVHLLGYRTDINMLCNSADIYALPSLQEGLSVALMEGMSCSLPCVVTDIRGNNDLIVPQKGGYLVQVGDIDEMASSIKLLCNDPVMREKMGRFNREHVQNFDLEHVRYQFSKIFTS